MCLQISVGCVRARFARHIAVLILIDACASALGFYLFGFAFAFGDGMDANGNLYGNNFIGFRCDLSACQIVLPVRGEVCQHTGIHAAGVLELSTLYCCI